MVYLQHQRDYARLPFMTQKAAIAAFLETARELDRYGQTHEACLFLPDKDYPDFILTLTKHGNVRKAPT